MRRPSPTTLVLALLLAVVTAGVGGAPAHAEGEFCTGAGVNVVVDYQSLGGGVQRACDEQGAGRTAQQVFTESGFALTPVGAFPGAACKVDGKPADVACAAMPPADAYWGLFLAKDGTWDYAPKGANELTLRDGDFIGFSWQSSKTPNPPGAQPVAASAAPPSEDEKASTRNQQAQDDGGFPWWVPAAVVVLLAAGAVVVVRRRARSGG